MEFGRCFNLTSTFFTSVNRVYPICVHKTRRWIDDDVELAGLIQMIKIRVV